LPGEITALLSAMFYSTSYLFLRKGQAESDPPDYGLLPILLISGAILTASVIVHNTALMNDPLYWHVYMWKQIALYGALSGILGTLFGRMALYAVIAKIGATRGIVIKTFEPVITFVIAVAVLDQAVHSLDLYGLICLFLAMVILTSERLFFPYRSIARRLFEQGIVWGAVATVLQGLGHVFRQLSMDTLHVNPLIAAAVEVDAALVAYLFLLAVSGKLISYGRYYVRVQSPYLLTAGFLSAAGVLLFFYAVSSAPVMVVSAITAMQPLLVTLLSVLFLRNLEKITVITIISVILAAIGVILVSAR
jgi:uncharacterized membrane protein